MSLKTFISTSVIAPVCYNKCDAIAVELDKSFLLITKQARAIALIRFNHCSRVGQLQ
ncbi:hypothetical protein I8748_22745 [Nostoc sp. CENA67]|uniref:Uncharacterized protein n=1 Tax=Amazonocrinis nigriterrae CENA67 TaxID=2794033 RepID=A0A8J7HSY9_9NOST|nr:hypothetical protein [Amazonocrinis nigriterrae]MBH8564967.1 hypothetical protein [Amazonocrinis nigriterrae CENA67]